MSAKRIVAGLAEGIVILGAVKSLTEPLAGNFVALWWAAPIMVAGLVVAKWWSEEPRQIVMRPPARIVEASVHFTPPEDRDGQEA